MKELMEYRSSLIDRIAEAANEFCEVCKIIGDPKTHLDGSWNMHQLVAHTRDIQKLVYGERAHKTVLEENPVFPKFDADNWMAEHYNSHEDVESMLTEFTADINSEVKWLRSLPEEAWNRKSKHVTMGSGYTLQTWVERGLSHIEEHLRVARKAKVIEE